MPNVLLFSYFKNLKIGLRRYALTGLILRLAEREWVSQPLIWQDWKWRFWLNKAASNILLRPTEFCWWNGNFWFTCSNCSSKLQFCWDENSDDGVDWDEVGGVRLPPPPPDRCCGVEGWVLLNGLRSPNCGRRPGNEGTRFGLFERMWDRGEVRYSRRNASRPARPRGGGSLLAVPPEFPLLSVAVDIRPGMFRPERWERGELPPAAATVAAMKASFCARNSFSISSRSSRSCGTYTLKIVVSYRRVIEKYFIQSLSNLIKFDVLLSILNAKLNLRILSDYYNLKYRIICFYSF